MNRYIDAERYKKKLLNWVKDCDQDDAEQVRDGTVIEDCAYSIDDEPSADVAPVIHAHWNCIENVHSYEGTFDAYECSHCHKSFLDDLCENNGSDYVDAKKDFKYCPFCGAKIDGDEHDTD